MPVAVGDEHLTINLYPLANPAVRLLSLRPLWAVAYRSAEATVPYVDGEQSYPSRLSGLRVVLPGILVGELDSDGVAHPDPRAGLTANFDELYAAVLAPVSTGDGTRAATWTRPGGITRTGVVKVLNFDVREQDATALSFSLSLLVPAGRLVAP